MFKISGTIIDVSEIDSKITTNKDGEVYNTEKHQELFIYSNKKLLKIKNKTTEKYAIGDVLDDVECTISAYSFNNKTGLTITI